jgi:hypothetical protein
MSGWDKALAVSMTPWNRSFFACKGLSISVSEAGRLIRASRSNALLLRWEIIDNIAHTPITIPRNTIRGMMSVRPTRATTVDNTVKAPRDVLFVVGVGP